MAGLLMRTAKNIIAIIRYERCVAKAAPEMRR